MAAAAAAAGGKGLFGEDAEMRAAHAELFKFYVSLKESGFSDKEAIYLTGVVLTNAMGGGDSPPDPPR